MGLYEDIALLHIKQAVNEKVEDGMTKTDAVYAVKRELVQITSAINAKGHYADAIDAMQKERDCTLTEALTALKLLVRSKYNDPSVWN